VERDGTPPLHAEQEALTVHAVRRNMRRYPRLTAWTLAVAFAVAVVLADAAAILDAGTPIAHGTRSLSLDAPDQEHNHNQVLLS
jgi:hypothetical protein